MSMTLRTAPFRFVSRIARGIGMFIAVSASAIRYTRKNPHDMSVSYRYATQLSSGFDRIFGLRHEIRNAERLLASQPCVYIANHRSNLDVMTLIPAFQPRTIVIGKQAVARIPFFGKVWVRSRNIVIDRADRDDSRAGIAAAEKAIREEGLSVFVFPEGTRDFGNLRPFKKGAFHLARNAGVPLQPIVCAVPRGWFAGSRLFMRKTTDVIIDVLEPIDPKKFEGVDDLLAHAREVMSAALSRAESEVESRS